MNESMLQGRQHAECGLNGFKTSQANELQKKGFKAQPVTIHHFLVYIYTFAFIHCIPIDGKLNQEIQMGDLIYFYIKTFLSN